MPRRAAPLLSIALLCGAPGIALAQPAEGGPVENTPRLCQNETDDDGDGLVDCADDGCRQLIFCVDYRPDEEGEEACGNGEDDDGDGATDCEDDGCVDVCGAISVPADADGPGSRGIYRPREAEEGPDVGYLEHESEREYPFGYAERPMTYLQGMLVPTLGLSVRNYNPDVWVQLGAGASFGVLDFLQVTLAPLPLRLSPDVGYESPALGMTLRFFDSEVVELGLYANVAVPLADSVMPQQEYVPRGSFTARARWSDVVQLDTAFLMRLHIAEVMRIDLALPVLNFVFVDDPVMHMDFDLSFGFSITDYAYAGVWSGVFLAGWTFDAPIVPLGLFAGGVIPGPSRRGPLMDLGLRFGWPTFATLDPPSGSDAVNVNAWQLTFDVRVFTYLLP